MDHDKAKLVEAVKSLVEPERYRDVLDHGCQSGTVGGLIYYSETVAFYNAHEGAIDDLISEMASDFGQSYLEFIGSLNGAKYVDNAEQLKNLLAWFACEEIVRQLSDEIEISEAE
jgi:hypothetical protein